MNEACISTEHTQRHAALGTREDSRRSEDSKHGECQEARLADRTTAHRLQMRESGKILLTQGT